MKNSFAIGIDLGGTKIEIALIDSDGQATENIKMPTQVEAGYEAIKNDIFQAIQALQMKAKHQIIGIGIGVPGQIHATDGTVIFAPNLKWENKPIQQDLIKMTKLPVLVTNDVRAAAWGEWLHGAGIGCQDLVCLFVGTGVGSGIIANGKLLQGATNAAGELGHTVILLNGPICTCGNRGCLEALASGWAIAKAAKNKIQEEPGLNTKILDLASGEIQNVTAKLVIEAYHEKDPLAIAVIAHMQEALVAGCVNIVNTFNPERLILGGGVLSNLPETLNFIQDQVAKLSLRAPSAKLKILPAALTKNAGAIGAGTMAWQTL
ncbi:MAG: hypothetical protein BGO14_04005 [Chlamydiales bacterium 38-26]|mgnify:CR=1 FL=1|nr:ROK family protein [Chlamydiales bacterium]OJV07662.1 MAG: hypothetical protein BGO14_04005 [Chlamydiales bacterium 38-26]